MCNRRKYSCNITVNTYSPVNPIQVCVNSLQHTQTQKQIDLTAMVSSVQQHLWWTYFFHSVQPTFCSISPVVLLTNLHGKKMGFLQFLDFYLQVIEIILQITKLLFGDNENSCPIEIVRQLKPTSLYQLSTNKVI